LRKADKFTEKTQTLQTLADNLKDELKAQAKIHKKEILEETKRYQILDQQLMQM